MWLLSEMKDTVYLDELCSLCTGLGGFINKRLREKDCLAFENIDEEVLKKHGINADTMILIRNEKAFIRSAAAIRTLLYMRWNWRWMFPFAWVIPLPLRDLVYIIVSKLRPRRE